MVGLSELEDFLVTVLWTAKVAGEHPLSVILRGPSAGGKSSVIKKMRSPIAMLHSDFTTREISQALRDNDVRFILLSDMQAIFAHKNTVVTMTVQAIRNLTEEGYFNDPYSGAKVERQLGFIMGVPSFNLTTDSEYKLRMFTQGDVSTRFLFVNFDYRRATIFKIHDYIEKGTKDTPARGIPQDPEQSAVVITPEVAASCKLLAQELKSDKMGTRIHLHLRTLVKAHALRHGRKEVTPDDYAYLLEFSDYIAGKERQL